MKFIAFTLAVFASGLMLGGVLAFRSMPPIDPDEATIPTEQPVRVISRPQWRLERSETERTTVPFTVPAEDLKHFTI